MSTDDERLRQEMRRWALDQQAVDLRHALARFTADVFRNVGDELHVVGHILGDDRARKLSPFGHGNDETVAISLLFRLASQLISASADLINDGREYAGTALIRQLVEIEYLAWAFETRDDEAAKWLRSTQKERLSFFSPAKLRHSSDGKFRGIDYSYHCEMGGHPVPRSGIILEDQAIGQLMLSDALGHSGRIWDHVVRWGSSSRYGIPIQRRCKEMSRRYQDWKAGDPLTGLPAPPDQFPPDF